MNNLKEQRFAVKFCVKLEKSTTETFAMLNTAYGDVAMKLERHFSGGINVSRMVGCLLKMMSVLNVLPYQLMTHTLMKSTFWCERIDV